MIHPAHLRRQADFILKHLRSPDDDQALAAAERLIRLPTLAELTPQELRRRAADVRRSHALEIVALEHGYASWNQVIKSENSDDPSNGKGRVVGTRGGGRRLPAPPSPSDLAQRVAERVRYFAEPLNPACGGGHRLDEKRVREEALAAILDALHDARTIDSTKSETSQ